MEFDTKAIHGGLAKDEKGDVKMPIYVSSTFLVKDLEKPMETGYVYSRLNNPTREALEKRLAMLENGKFGLAFASGMAAETCLAMSLLKAGDHVVAFDDLYGGTKDLFNNIMKKNFEVELTYVDAREPENVKEAIKSNTKLVWLETPTNPLMKICDIKAISSIARRHGVLTVVDNTFLSPYFQRPLECGADIVIHSTTKYINGHSDSIGGEVIVSDENVYKKIKFTRDETGSAMSPFDSFLVLRGLETLPVRMEKHQQNAKSVVEYLKENEHVEEVYYPGIKDHPQIDVIKRQMTGYGGTLSFLMEGKRNEINKFLTSLKIFSFAVSLGGTESLVENPAYMTHFHLSTKEREKIGIKDGLIRMSVGLEDPKDMIADLEQAFTAAFSGR